MSVTAKLGETVYYDFTTHDPSTGELTNADAPPTCAVFENDTDIAILAPTVTQRGVLTGSYRVAVAATTGNGFEVGKTYNVHASAMVGGVSAQAVLDTFVLESLRLGDIPAAVWNSLLAVAWAVGTFGEKLKSAVFGGGVLGVVGTSYSISNQDTIEVRRGDTSPFTFTLDVAVAAADVPYLTVKVKDPAILDIDSDTNAVIGPRLLTIPTPGGYLVTWTPTAAEAIAMTPDVVYAWDIEITRVGGAIVTPASGNMVLVRDVKRKPAP